MAKQKKPPAAAFKASAKTAQEKAGDAAIAAVVWTAACTAVFIALQIAIVTTPAGALLVTLAHTQTGVMIAAGLSAPYIGWHIYKNSRAQKKPAP